MLIELQSHSTHSDGQLAPRDVVAEAAQAGVTTLALSDHDSVAGVPEAALEKIVAQVPVGRLGQPDDVARVVEFLADPDSGYITGQVYSVNGGLFMSS